MLHDLADRADTQVQQSALDTCTAYGAHLHLRAVQVSVLRNLPLRGMAGFTCDL